MLTSVLEASIRTNEVEDCVESVVRLVVYPGITSGAGTCVVVDSTFVASTLCVSSPHGSEQYSKGNACRKHFAGSSGPNHAMLTLGAF